MPLKSLQRKYHKKKTLFNTLRSPQENKGVVNIHRLDTHNVGDFYCAPHHYFDELTNKSLDIFAYKREDKTIRENFVEQVSGKGLIIGGGGLLNRNGFSNQMNMFEKLGDKGKKVVLWGVGHNSKEKETYDKVKEYNIDVSNFGLVGTRDKSMPGEYVPCVSCLHPIFDKTYDSTQEIGVVFHKDTLKKPKILSLFEDYPTSSNTTDLHGLINFIGASEKIVTDSYHVMYWSMLMGRKVVVIPNSSKFFDFQHRPVFTTFEDALGAFAKAETYPSLLAECREINRTFAAKAFDYLNI
tara:strand:+ start:38513 stop:39403 length:891 start_codon:yes stop_codon:yes gene_type:complete